MTFIERHIPRERRLETIWEQRQRQQRRRGRCWLVIYCSLLLTVIVTASRARTENAFEPANDSTIYSSGAAVSSAASLERC